MELPQTVDVDRAVVHPDTVQPEGCFAPEVEPGLVARVKDIVHFRTVCLGSDFSLR